jgi:CheY-like chemotaxis protein
VGDGPGRPEAPLRILVVDDEPMLLSLVREVLEADGHAVIAAASADGALEQLAARPFDLAIVDLALGAGPSGWDVAQAVRERQPSVRVVLATGWGAVDTERARALGVAGVLRKPYQIAELQQATRACPVPDAAAGVAAAYQAV